MLHRVRGARFQLADAVEQREALAQGVEQVRRHRFGRRAGERTQRRQRRRRLVAHQQHAQAVGVLELERRIAAAQLFPQLPDAEPALAHHGVVEQHHAPARHLRQPGVEIVLHRVVGVQAVDVQQVHAAVREIRPRLVEQHAHQLREAGVLGLHHAVEAVVHLVAVQARVFVAFPRVHGEGLGARAAGLDGLAERQERRAVVRAQLHQDVGPGFFHHPERERQVAHPGAGQHVLGHHGQAGVGRQRVHARGACRPMPSRASHRPRRWRRLMPRERNAPTVSPQGALPASSAGSQSVCTSSSSKSPSLASAR